MDIEYKDKTFVSFESLGIGDCFLYHGRVCMKTSPMNVLEEIDSDEVTEYNAIYLDNGYTTSLEPRARFLPIKMKLVEV